MIKFDELTKDMAYLHIIAFFREGVLAAGSNYLSINGTVDITTIMCVCAEVYGLHVSAAWTPTIDDFIIRIDSEFLREEMHANASAKS